MERILEPSAKRKHDWEERSPEKLGRDEIGKRVLTENEAPEEEVVRHVLSRRMENSEVSRTISGTVAPMPRVMTTNSG